MMVMFKLARDWIDVSQGLYVIPTITVSRHKIKFC